MFSLIHFSVVFLPALEMLLRQHLLFFTVHFSATNIFKNRQLSSVRPQMDTTNLHKNKQNPPGFHQWCILIKCVSEQASTRVHCAHVPSISTHLSFPSPLDRGKGNLLSSGWQLQFWTLTPKPESLILRRTTIMNHNEWSKHCNAEKGSCSLHKTLCLIWCDTRHLLSLWHFNCWLI